VKESSDEAEGGERGRWAQYAGTKKKRPEVSCFLFALFKGACFSELAYRRLSVWWYQRGVSRGIAPGSNDPKIIDFRLSGISVG